MVPHVLGVGYAYNEYEVTAGRWKEFEIEFDYADNIKQAAAMLSFKEYICVAICSDVIPQDDLDILRQKRAVPIIVVPPSYSEEQRYACVHFGAAQYLHTYNHPKDIGQNSRSGIPVHTHPYQRSPTSRITFFVHQPMHG